MMHDIRSSWMVLPLATHLHLEFVRAHCMRFAVHFLQDSTHLACRDCVLERALSETHGECGTGKRLVVGGRGTLVGCLLEKIWRGVSLVTLLE